MGNGLQLSDNVQLYNLEIMGSKPTTQTFGLNPEYTYDQTSYWNYLKILIL